MNYLNISELSEYIHLSSSAIYKMTSRRRIPYIKSGKKLLFKRDAIDDWLAGHYFPTKEEIDNSITNILKPLKNG
jgi:excisionase family DNA binding protein